MHLNKKNIRSILKKIIIAFLIIHAAVIVVIFILALNFKKNNPSNTTLMLYRNHFDNQDIGKLHFLPIADIPEKVIAMLVFIEDPGFYSHHGVQLKAMANAYLLNMKSGYKKWGGSTITQQLARSLILYPGKTYLRKYLELITALIMELVMPKIRILELYVNYIEFGKGIFGIGNAAEHYFGRPLNRLSRVELIELITILPNPIIYNPGNFMENEHLKLRYLLLRRKFLIETKAE